MGTGEHTDEHHRCRTAEFQYIDIQALGKFHNSRDLSACVKATEHKRCTHLQTGCYFYLFQATDQRAFHVLPHFLKEKRNNCHENQ